MAILNVWRDLQLVGSLRYEQGLLAFRYAADYLNLAAAQPLSFSLPLQADEFSGVEVVAFFGGLLPEGRLRDLVARQQGLSSKNDFSLLNVLGGDCAGAISLLPENESPKQAANDIQWLTDTELAKCLVQLPQRPMLAGEDGIRLSLAGAQDKLPVVFDGKRIGLPLNGTASTHILKTPIQGLTDTVSNEAFCLALATRAGIPAAAAQLYPTGETQVLLVERYDRVQEPDGTVSRIHQEDFCQALGVVADAKYQREGGPSLADCFDLLRQATKPFAPQLLRLLDYLIFHTLVGNHDAHGKNFSFLYGERAELAPLYDVVCTAVYPSLTPKMAMKIDSQYEFEHVMPHNWGAMAQQCGLSPQVLKKRLRYWAERLPSQATVLAKSGPSNNGVVNEVVALITSRSNKTLRLLARQEL